MKCSDGMWKRTNFDIEGRDCPRVLAKTVHIAVLACKGRQG